ncbi:GDP-mannose 4,6-dehydratase [Salinarimonas sp. NSM]|uniref:GDP-mannose 4,6-dehydratase n=1 Tax=Salinarimonas sp. NSM TaxID=3458003 RepID=UPI00403741C5
MSPRARFWRDRRVLVTGASGLVGSHLTRELVSLGCDVVALVRDWVPGSPLLSEEWARTVTLVRGDVCDQAAMERILGEHEIASVIHLAAQTIVPIANRNPVSTFETNVAGTWRLLEAARRSPKVSEIVVASSDKAYGQAAVLPYTEETPLAGLYPYDASKSCADLIAQSYAATYRTPVAITRCGNFFGGGDLNWSRIVPGTIRSLIAGERPVIRSDGTLVRDYIYVGDAVEAYMTLTERLAENRALAGRGFNFSTEIPLSARALVDLIRARMGSDVEPIVLGEATHEIAEQYLDASRARAELGWAPRYGLEEGLDRTIAWYRERLAR